MFLRKKRASLTCFEYKGYRIPVDLAYLTGGGPDTWEPVSRHHMDAYDRYTPIDPSASVLELGCGVGRDAIELTGRLSERGSYIGLDINEPCIEWCRKNIAGRYPNFRFCLVDVYSQLYNPRGTVRVQDVTLPADASSIDRILLQSVFTHMFRDDIVHYFRELRRVLKPDGLAFATFFVLDDTARAAIEKARPPLTFEHRYEDYRVNNPRLPEHAVAYSEITIAQMLERGGLTLAQPIHYGNWSGRENAEYSQDLLVLRRT
jgi:SAM-dependent methyltransferase